MGIVGSIWGKAQQHRDGELGKAGMGAVGVGCDCGGRNVEAGMLWCLSNWQVTLQSQDWFEELT